MNILVEKIYETIQGEGYYAGAPCTIVRTWGCPVGCWFCDTGYAAGSPPPAKRFGMDVEVIKPARRHVVITGGEPMSQKATAPLAGLLVAAGHLVQIETSGAAWVDTPDDCWITLSPKAHLGARCIKKYWRRADEVKIVISSPADAKFYQEQLRGYAGRIYFQPEYSKLETVVPLCIEACLAYGGRVSVQAHKLIGLP